MILGLAFYYANTQVGEFDHDHDNASINNLYVIMSARDSAMLLPGSSVTSINANDHHDETNIIESGAKHLLHINIHLRFQPSASLRAKMFTVTLSI